MLRLAAVTAFVLGLAWPAAAGTLDSLTIDYEAGPLYIGVNEGRYGRNGTLYQASDVAQNRNLFVSQRLSAEAALGRHTVVLLYAPLDVTTRVRLETPLTFRETTFPAGTVVDSRYLFDGLRASYLYRLVEMPQFHLDLGGSLQVRNAAVAFSELAGTRYDVERDIGLVPALKVRLRYDSPQGPYALWEADGLSSFGIASVKGGILDTALTLGVPVAAGWDATLRLRYLTGGADVPNRDIYNWGHFFAATAGFRWDLVPVLESVGQRPKGEPVP